MDISVVIPVYNGEKTIARLYRNIEDELSDDYEWEVLFVFDCGKDNSWQIISELAKKTPHRIRAFRLDRNYGQHRAILYGLTEAKGQLIITMDEDLQHDPAYIKELIRKQAEGNYDVVYARFSKLRHPGMRIATSEMLRKTLKRIVPGLDPCYSPFRLITRETAAKLTMVRRSYAFIDGFLGLATDNFGHIDARHYKRADGESSYTYSGLFKHAVNIAIAYSPLKKWLLTISLLLILAALITIAFTGSVVFTSLNSGIAGIAIAAGALFIILSLIAEIIHYRGVKNNSLPVASELV